MKQYKQYSTVQYSNATNRGARESPLVQGDGGRCLACGFSSVEGKKRGRGGGGADTVVLASILRMQHYMLLYQQCSCEAACVCSSYVPV